ncbi:Arc family DNA-binding protein [uncultured Ruegeria sp.]|uniref:Arc family DNA-binding protein n=1 Tax=uncultured Ruegeria sp. TaxID=259304 RepID=UPI00262D5715|nr:Arc family DNA-binding protein [uncultured Ruegeria sp.]
MRENRTRKDAFMLRLNDGLRDTLKKIAEQNCRSMTSEINLRLMKSLEADQCLQK